ncbi:ABC transporter permease [Sporofaciens musculi]|jgi:hypothetical protein|uniref:ABC transporter permease n=1 Tax=Sporofaciens musculi TaxID=2681861 RepID=UPI0025710554|nr:ABC transporter permease [Sporofaciens musculi]
MNAILEYKKIRRTGVASGCLLGGCLAAFVPILELAVRSEQYVGIPKPPLQIILQADWQMMAMLNTLLVIVISCMMYHIEYTDNAIQRITTLPVREEEVFVRKTILLSGMCIVLLVIEMLSLIFCTLHWFGGENGAYVMFYGDSFWGAYMKFIRDLLQNFGYSFCMLLPVAIVALMTASAWKNMWIPLGINVVCVFMATMIPVKYFALSIFPFALPFQILEGAKSGKAISYLIAAAAEVLLIGAAEMVFLKVRRSLA